MIIISIIIAMLIMVVIFVFSLTTKTKHLSGKKGESEVSNFLNSIKQNDEVVIDNYLASRNKEKTYSIQIDHIFISHKGIFVIETKSHHGSIYGYSSSNYWTQYIGNSENKFYNPLKQNETHCRYLYEKLNKKYFCFNVVIFLNAVINCDPGCSNKLFSLESFYSWYTQMKCERYLDSNEINRIQDKINYLQNTHLISAEMHIQNIKNNHY